MAVEVVTSHQQISDANGNPLSGAKIYIYDVGTTTLKTVYSDSGLTTTAANPIVCDSSGRHPIRYIATGSYKYWVKTSADVSVFDAVDNVDGRVPVGSGALAIANGGTGATTASAALAALGGATAAEVADIASDVAGLVGASGSSEKTHIATGTTAQRPTSPAHGDFRRNTTTSRLEHYNGSAWEQLFTDTEIATTAEAKAGSNNTKVMTPATSLAASPFTNYLHVREEQASGINGGTFTSGSFVKRTLNTTVANNITGASIASSQITLPAGTYYITASAPARSADGHIAKLRNVTDSTDTIIGTNEGSPGRSFVKGEFTIAAQKVFELQHRCTTSRNNDGLGSACTFGVNEVYSEVIIQRLPS